MNRNKKIYKTLMGVTLASSLVLSGAVPQNGLHITQVSAASEQNQEKRVIYVDGTKSDSGDGTSKASAVNSLEKAKELSSDGAKILVCGTITISEETTLRMPTQFEVSRAEGFSGPILAVTGKGKVTLTYAWLNESDVDTSKADLGKSAFVVGQKEEQKAEQGETKDQNTKKEDTKEENSEKTDTKEDASKDTEESSQKETEQKKKTPPEVVLPGSLTMSEPGALNTLSLTENFSGDGTFRFAEPDKVMDTYQSQQQIIFTPNDTETYDYSGVEGWSAQGQEVVRYITVFVDSLKPQETQGEQDNSKEETKDEKSQGNKNETVTENPAGDTVQEENKNTSEQTPSDSENESETTDKTPETPEAPTVSNEQTQENTGEQQAQEAENTGKEKDTSGEASNETAGEQTVRNIQNQDTADLAQTEENAPIGNLEDSATGIKVDGDFLPPYVDLRVSKITDSEIEEEADIEAILKSYEITLWNLKTDEEYEVPEGKKVTVMIPVPEGAQLYESLIIAHYMEEKGEYEYFAAGQNLNLVDGYLVFETASFSPFNIGGNQLVGIGTKSPNHKPGVSYYSDATAGSLTMVPAAGNTMASSKTGASSNSSTKKNSTDSSAKSGTVIASSGIGTNLNRSSSSQSDSSVTPIERPTLLTAEGSSSTSGSTTASTSSSSNAKTGDNMNLFAWMGAGIASFAVLVKADLTRKRRRNSRKYMK